MNVETIKDVWQASETTITKMSSSDIHVPIHLPVLYLNLHKGSILRPKQLLTKDY